MQFLKTIFLIITEFNLLYFDILNISPVNGFEPIFFQRPITGDYIMELLKYL